MSVPWRAGWVKMEGLEVEEVVEEGTVGARSRAREVCRSRMRLPR